jgi:hypothetical protein
MNDGFGVMSTERLDRAYQIRSPVSRASPSDFAYLPSGRSSESSSFSKASSTEAARRNTAYCLDLKLFARVQRRCPSFSI